MIRQRVHDGHADAVQAAGCLVGLAVELAAGMQHGEDDLERRLARHLRVVFDRDAAAVVGDGQEALGIEMDLDEIGVAGDGLVHRVVDDFGEEVVQRLLVRAADIHAGTHAHRLQPFQHADRRGVVIAADSRRGRHWYRDGARHGLFLPRHGFRGGLGWQAGEKVVAVVLHGPFRVCSVCRFQPSIPAERGVAE